MTRHTTRREFLTDAALLTAASAAVRAAGAAPGGSAEKMPTIKLGSVEVSRLILGSNPFFGFAHGNPQAKADEMRQWYSEERTMAVLDAAAERGITAVWTPCYERWIELWNKYREKGGKLKTWIGQPDSFDKMTEHITACAKNGGKAVCIQGECVDRAYRQNDHARVKGWLEHIKGLGLPAGMASHKPTTHLIAEEKQLPADFYHQCVYQPENYSAACWEQAMATIGKLAKPVVAYKVLAAGRTPPAKAFAELFKHLKPKDGLCVGVFPRKHDELAENAALARKLTAEAARKLAMR